MTAKISTPNIFHGERSMKLLEPLKIGVRCSGIKHDGCLCNHKVAVIPLDEWEQARVSGIEIECRRCGKLTKLRDFL